jgi:transposase
MQEVMRMKNKEKFDSKQRSQIRHWKKKTREAKLYRKIEVLDYAAKGYTHREISNLTDFSISRISDLVREFIKNGIGYFTKEHRRGNSRRNLTSEQEEQIINEYREKAINGQVVSLSEMKKRYEEIRGKETANSTFYDFLKRMKWRRVMPRGSHPKKATEEAIDASKKLTI